MIHSNNLISYPNFNPVFFHIHYPFIIIIILTFKGYKKAKPAHRSTCAGTGTGVGTGTGTTSTASTQTMTKNAFGTSSTSLTSEERTSVEKYELPSTAVCEILQCDANRSTSSPINNGSANGNSDSNSNSSSCGVLQPIALIENSLSSDVDPSVNIAIWHPVPGNGLLYANVCGAIVNYHHSFPAHAL